MLSLFSVLQGLSRAKEGHIMKFDYIFLRLGKNATNFVKVIFYIYFMIFWTLFYAQNTKMGISLMGSVKSFLFFCTKAP